MPSITKQDKKKGGKPNIIRSEDEDSDDERCNKDEALENNKKAGKKNVKLLSDIYNTTEGLSKRSRTHKRNLG